MSSGRLVTSMYSVIGIQVRMAPTRVCFRRRTDMGGCGQMAVRTHQWYLQQENLEGFPITIRFLVQIADNGIK